MGMVLAFSCGVGGGGGGFGFRIFFGGCGKGYGTRISFGGGQRVWVGWREKLGTSLPSRKIRHFWKFVSIFEHFHAVL